MNKYLPKVGSQKQLYDGYFWEYVVRKKYFSHCSDKFMGFLELIKRVCHPKEIAEDKENYNTSTDLFDD